MFVCECCKKLSKPGEKPIRKPIAFREKDYYRKETGPTGIARTVFEGRGKEIAKELIVCNACA